MDANATSWRWEFLYSLNWKGHWAIPMLKSWIRRLSLVFPWVGPGRVMLFKDSCFDKGSYYLMWFSFVWMNLNTWLSIILFWIHEIRFDLIAMLATWDGMIIRLCLLNKQFLPVTGFCIFILKVIVFFIRTFWPHHNALFYKLSCLPILYCNFTNNM